MNERFTLPIICVVAFVLQVVVAPNLPLGIAVPSFLVPLVLCLAILRNPGTCYVLAFVLGLLTDLLSSTPVGLSALLLLIAVAVLERAFEVLDKSTFVMPVIALVSGCFAIELVKLIALLVLGYQASPIDLFLQASLPDIIANSLIGVAYYFIFVRLGIAQTSSGNAWVASVGNQRFR